jgi:arsenate reductase (glutaredoxin)
LQYFYQLKRFMIKIYHNNRCGKSRSAINLLKDKDLEFEIVEYLKNPLSEKELHDLINLLEIKPIELVRTKENLWIENFKEKSLSDVEIIKILSENPILIERPIVVNGKKAIIARLTELIENIL